jgi:hypothetical protein
MKKCEECTIGVEYLEYEGYSLVYESQSNNLPDSNYTPFKFCPDCGNENEVNNGI